jgi:hypothetical protein
MRKSKGKIILKKAKVNYAYAINMIGMLITTTSFLEIKGAQTDKCFKN